MDVEQMVVSMCQAAKKAARTLATASTPVKNQALLQAATRLRQNSGALLAANFQDVEAGRNKGLSSAMLDRLTLTEARIDTMAKGLEIIADLPDPIGETLTPVIVLSLAIASYVLRPADRRLAGPWF